MRNNEKQGLSMLLILIVTIIIFVSKSYTVKWVLAGVCLIIYLMYLYSTRKPKEKKAKPDCRNHPKDLFGKKDMKVVGDAIANMDYRVLPLLLFHLSKKIEADGENDYKGGRVKLASELQYLSMGIFEAALRAEKVAKISKPFMKKE